MEGEMDAHALIEAEFIGIGGGESEDVLMARRQTDRLLSKFIRRVVAANKERRMVTQAVAFVHTLLDVSSVQGAMPGEDSVRLCRSCRPMLESIVKITVAKMVRIAGETKLG